MDSEEVLAVLRGLGRPEYLEGMKRFGIDTSRALGVKIPELRGLAKKTGKNHNLALALWDTAVHEARILASMVDDPARVTPRQIEAWAREFSSWDLCDQVCGNLFDRTPHWLRYAVTFTDRKPEMVKRAGFVLMAESAVHRTAESDEVFTAFFPLIERGASDERNYVKKAVSWALRQIGKRSRPLREESIRCAERIGAGQSASARWIARDVLRELQKS
jgi:3-methyladenine DNA glycosylase AlkD